MRGIFLLLFSPPFSDSGIMLLSFIQGSSKHWWIIRSTSDLDCSRKMPDALALAVEGFRDGADRDTRGGFPSELIEVHSKSLSVIKKTLTV